MKITLSSLRLPNDIMEIIKKQAQQDNCSVSNYLTKIIVDFATHKKEQEIDEETRLAIQEAREESLKGETTKIEDINNIWKSIL